MADEKKKDAKDAKAPNKEGDEGGSSAEAAPKPSKKKLFIAIGGVVGTLLLIGIPVAFFAMKPDEKKTEDLSAHAAMNGPAGVVPEGASDIDESSEDEEALGAIFPLETFVVNLAGGGFIRAQVQLEFTGKEVPVRFYGRLVPIRDGIIALLANRTKGDIETAKGKDTLKVDLKELINDILKREEVRSVYFTQFLIQ